MVRLVSLAELFWTKRIVQADERRLMVPSCHCPTIGYSDPDMYCVAGGKLLSYLNCSSTSALRNDLACFP
jgi:hypothetical protein